MKASTANGKRINNSILYRTSFNEPYLWQQTPDGWTCDPHNVDQMGFWAFHVDSLFWSVFLGSLFIVIFKMSNA